jgi:hypothetical protein
LIGPSRKKTKNLRRLPKIKFSILKYRLPPVWPSYIGERRTTFGKAYGIKVRCHGELGEHIENLMGTHLELKRNIVRTHWEPGKMKKKSFSSPNLRGKTATHLECMVGPSHWLHEISLPN